jgi:hypothetical protein
LVARRFIRAQLIRVRWLRRSSASCQSLVNHRPATAVKYLALAIGPG